MSSTKSFNSNYIIGISFISALGGYLFGFDFAVISGALPFLRTQFALTDVSEGFLTGSLALGCIVGCLVAGNIADKYGRKPGLIISALIFAVSSIGIAFSPSLAYFLVLRFAAGIGVGMASMLCPMYIAEVSPAEVRGRNVAINQLTVVIGILVTNLVNYFLADKDLDAVHWMLGLGLPTSGYDYLRGIDSWRWMFGLGAVPSTIFLIGVTWLPESPRWLMKSGQTEKAMATLNKIGSADFVESTFKAVKKSLEGSGKQTYAMVFEKAVRPAVVVGITLAVFQQFCGSNILFNYASTIFKEAGSSVDHQLLETVFIGVVNLIFTVLAMFMVDKLGRRPLMLIGSIGLSISFIVLAFLLQSHAPVLLLSIVVLSAISVYSFTLAPVTWVLISEIFPNKIRGVASSVAIVSLWLAYFILVFTFPILAKKLGTYGPFYLYAGICFAGFLFVKAKVKETKGQTLEELEDNLVRH